MRLSVKLYVVFILTLFPVLLNAQQQAGCVPVFTRSGQDAVYCAGEKLDFVLHYKFGIINSDIGQASVTLDTTTVDSRKVFHTRVYGKTISIYDRFFRVREDFNSYYTFDGLRPLVFTRDTHEGSYVATDSYRYIWDAPEPYIDAEVFTTSLGEKKIFKLPLKECTFDLPALFFFARNIDMSKVRPNVKYPMTFAIDEEVYDVYFIYRGKTTVKVKGLGKVRCLKFAAKLLEGQVFKGEADLDIYISDDMNRLPVLFGAPIRVGEVEGRMTGYEGLKYPFSALISTK